MLISKNAPPKQFVPVQLTFSNEAELHDVIAALAAYGQKRTSVSGSGIPSQLGLSKYTGNARRTVNALLPLLKQQAL